MRFKKSSDIKAGVIGYGAAYNMGRRHLNDMKAAGMTPLAVAEINPQRRKVAEHEFPGIETYASAASMLKKSAVNLVAVVAPHNTHAKMVLQCLKAGRHVVCEKPLAITTIGCDAVIREAKKNRLLLSAFHNRHWDGCIMEAVKHIRKERIIGDVFRIEAHMGNYMKPGNWWRSSKSVSGGILYDWGVHLLEYSLQLIESDMIEVAGYAHKGFWAPKTTWKNDTNEDESFVVVRFKNSAWLTLCVSNLDSNPKRGMLEVTGTNGTYIMDHNKYEIIRRKGNYTVVTRGRNMPSRWEEYYRNVCDHLVKGKKLIITPEWARKPIHILDLANRSVSQGKALKTKYK